MTLNYSSGALGTVAYSLATNMDSDLATSATSLAQGIYLYNKVHIYIYLYIYMLELYLAKRLDQIG